MTMAKNTVPSLSNSRLTFGWRIDGVTDSQVGIKQKKFTHTFKEHDLLVYLGVGAGVGELPHFAFAVAERTHGDVGLTDLLSTARQEARLYDLVCV